MLYAPIVGRVVMVITASLIKKLESIILILTILKKWRGKNQLPQRLLLFPA